MHPTSLSTASRPLGAGVLLALFCLLPASSLLAEDPASATAKALAALHGTWEVDKFVNNGEEQDLAITLKIDGKQVVAMLNENKVELKMTIDPLCTPKVIDLTFVPPDGAQAETTLEGIYEVRENRLRMCLVPPQGVRARPQKFESPADSERVLLSFTRIAP